MTNDELYALVPVGKENAVPIEWLVSATGIRARLLRRLFNHDLLKEKKIVANLQGGYFRPKNKEELESYYRFRHKYANEHMRVTKAIERILRRYDNITMDL